MRFLRFFKKTGYLTIAKSRKRMRLLVSLLIVGLILPLIFLLHQTFLQLEKESYFIQRQNAEALVEQINRRALEILRTEDDRPIKDYFFLHYTDSRTSTPVINFSPLSSFPPITATPGIIGYFQIRPDGTISSPLLPQNFLEASRFGLSGSDVQLRANSLRRVQNILLHSTRLGTQGLRPSGLQTSREWTGNLSSFFDHVDALSPSSFQSFLWGSERLSSLKFTRPFPSSLKDLAAESKYRTGQELSLSRFHYLKGGTLTPLYDPFLNDDSPLTAENSGASTHSPPSRLSHPNRFSPLSKRRLVPESGVDESLKSSLEFKILPTGEGLFFRKVAINGQRHVQGFIVDHSVFLKSVFGRIFENSTLASNTNFLVAYNDVILSQHLYEKGDQGSQRLLTPAQASSSPSIGEDLLILQAGLSGPFEGFELLFSTDKLPASPAKPVVTTLSVVVIFVLLLGIYLIYRLALNQLIFAKQRSDFVSAVSHELKTPLTSIRMYGEMLRDGWVQDEGKKKSYYDYIFFESERLSRLISNVLYLTRHANETKTTNLKSFSPQKLMEFVLGKVESTVVANGFKLNEVVHANDSDRGNDTLIKVNEDFICQMFINLIDNAMKFSKKSEPKQVDIGYRIIGDPPEKVCFFVRDYGPGVEKKDREKIFELFFRSGDEMTRTTSGTGMGLALVQQMADLMGAQVHFRAAQPGSEFRLEFKIQKEEPRP